MTEEKMIELIQPICKCVIEKPRSKSQLLGMSEKKGEPALEYQLPSTTKKVTITEFLVAYEELKKNSFIDHSWYTKVFPNIYGNSPCNFTTIGAVFVKLGFAEYRKSKYWEK